MQLLGVLIPFASSQQPQAALPSWYRESVASAENYIYNTEPCVKCVVETCGVLYTRTQREKCYSNNCMTQNCGCSEKISLLVCNKISAYGWRGKCISAFCKQKNHRSCSTCYVNCYFNNPCNSKECPDRFNCIGKCNENECECGKALTEGERNRSELSCLSRDYGIDDARVHLATCILASCKVDSTTTSQLTEDGQPTQKEGSSSIWIYVGIGIGCAVVLTLILLAAWWVYHKKEEIPESRETATPEIPESPSNAEQP